VFRSRRGTSIRILVYDGQGFWLAQKRLSKGKFVSWPSGNESARRLEAHQAQLLLVAGNPETEAAPVLAQGELKQKARVLHFLVTCCGHGANLALPRTEDHERVDYAPERVHSGAPRQQPLETIAAAMRGVGLETGQRRLARRGLPWPVADVGAGRADRVTAGALADPGPVPNPAAAAGAVAAQRRTARDEAAGTRLD
jgi:hypothetical protein